MIKKILAGMLLAGVSYGWVTQSDIAANNLLQYSPAAKPGDVIGITRPGVAGPVAGMTYTTNGWVFENIIVTSNATFPSPMLVTDVVAETIAASTSITINGTNVVTETELAAETSAREAADATKVDINNGTATNLTLAVAAKFPAVAGGTNYVASMYWDATNKVFVVMEAAE